MSENKTKFLSEFFKRNSKVGSITPSSRFLAKKMLDSISFKEDTIIAEFGPGTGVFTKQIVEKMSSNSKLYVFELNSGFLQVLKNEIKTEKDVKFICDSAGKLKDYLQKDGITHVDYIVSSLPLSLFSIDNRKNIIQDAYDTIREGGKMTQFQYTEQCKNLFVEQFKNVKVKFTPFNIPPAFVYVCEK